MPTKKHSEKKSSKRGLLDWLKSYLHPEEEYANLDPNLTEDEKRLLSKFRDLD